MSELSDRMAELGRPIGASGLSKIEQGDRSVDVDDLVALAIALEVSPNRLLMPPTASEAEEVALTPAVRVPENWAWAWAAGEHTLDEHGGREDERRFIRQNRPHDPMRLLTDEEFQDLLESGDLDTFSAGYREACDAGLADDTIRAFLFVLRRAEYLNRLRAKRTEH